MLFKNYNVKELQANLSKEHFSLWSHLGHWTLSFLKTLQNHPKNNIKSILETLDNKRIKTLLQENEKFVKPFLVFGILTELTLLIC